MGDVVSRIVIPSPLYADAARRMPPRPPSLQDPGYLEEYDDRTVFYDAFRVGRHRVLAVGPPAENFAAGIRDSGLVSAEGAREAAAFTVEGGLDRLGRFWARHPARATAPLTVRSPLSEGGAVVGEDLASLFAGTHAVMTLSKDNRLEWVTFWADWYVRRHGADAVLVYDNGSTAYSSSDLLACLSQVAGIRVAVVVEWAFPYGPLGDPWDSNYCQHGALEHARWRFLRRAAGFLNADIDELVADLDSQSVFTSAVRSATGVVALPSIDVLPAPGSRVDPPRFADQYHIGLPPGWVERAKWCVVPARLPPFAQATTHEVIGVASRSMAPHRIWHCRSISTYAPRVHATMQPSEIEVDLKARIDRVVPPVAERPLRSRPIRDVGVRLMAMGRPAFERLRERVVRGVRRRDPAG